MQEAPIGSPEWFDLVNPNDMAEAKRLIAARTPVFATWTDELGDEDGVYPVWAVVFEGTNFWAGAFASKEHGNQEAKEMAEAYAWKWNEGLIWNVA